MRQSPIRLFAALLTATLAAQSPLYRTAIEPGQDPAMTTLPAGILFAIPGVADDFVLSGGGQFVELPDGTARLTARIRSDVRIYAGMLIDLQFGGRIDPGQPAHPPAGYPDLQLVAAAYAPVGTVQPATFHYYTTGSGMLRGHREFDGARVQLTMTGALQVGNGANNRNGDPGAQATFTVQVLQPPSGGSFGAVSTATLRVDLDSDRSQDATHTMINSSQSPLSSDRGLVLPGVGEDYLFVPAAAFVETTTGQATLNGTLARISDLADTWSLSLNLSGRLDAGQVGHPPVGSPVQGLLASQYLAHGGPIDTANFHYYAAATGTLTGTGINAGGVIALTPNGAFQVGAGANQANLYFGGYGRLNATVQTQPTQRTIGIIGTAELHLLTGTFPVLPFPVVTSVSTTNLSSLTDQGITVTGDNFAWLVAVQWGGDWIAGTTASQWRNGWFEVLDNQHVVIHPVAGRAPGNYPVSVTNPVVPESIGTISLVAPTAPTLRSEGSRDAGATQHILVHHGNLTGPVLTAIAFSFELSPSVLPGVVSLGIGNQFQSLTVAPGMLTHDPITGIAELPFGPLPAGIGTFDLHWQAAVVPLSGTPYPLPVSDVWTAHYTL
ncbi:MAG: hypothetical protein IPK26_22105 [Planctomycetes bacterium]|nr:hypothetical protein [Planctomycetota bacterium]